MKKLKTWQKVIKFMNTKRHAWTMIEHIQKEKISYVPKKHIVISHYILCRCQCGYEREFLPYFWTGPQLPRSCDNWIKINRITKPSVNI